MTTIIVATDFSPLAENAVNYAAAIAQRHQARLVLFNAFTVPVSAANGMLSAADFDGLLLDSQNRLKESAEQIAESHRIWVHYESAYLAIPEALENLLSKYQAQLIVLGMEPESLTQELFGNTTTAVISKLYCPVLAVPEGIHFDGLKKILFACDAAQGLPAGILQQVKATALALNAEVEVFFVETADTDTPNAKDLISAGLEGIAYSYKQVRSDAVTPAIRQELVTTDADLLIMAPQEYGFWPSVVHRSKTRMMASGLNIPLLAIHAWPGKGMH